MYIKPKPVLYKDILFRSTLEANYARLFDKYELEWTYEPKKFDYGELGYGTGKHKLYYTPDFHFLHTNIFLECKPKLALDVRSKEMWFVVLNRDKELFFGLSYFPALEPETVSFFEGAHVCNDGYSDYVIDEGVEEFQWNDFISMIYAEQETTRNKKLNLSKDIS